MARIVAMLNMKGGVGKTTTAVVLAEILAATHGRRVLVIDLDPQTNATVMLIGEERWRDLNEAGLTLAGLFEAALDPDRRRFDLEGTLQRGASGVKTARSLDLLPASLDMIDVEHRLATVPAGRFGAVRPCDLLWRAIRDILDGYDDVIIDCPPNLGPITQNGLRVARSILIPAIPDILSTYGIPQLVTRVRTFSREVGVEVAPAGIVITKFQANSTVHNNTVSLLEQNHRAAPEVWPRVFETRVPQGNAIAAAAAFGHYATLNQKWAASPGIRQRLETLAAELIEAMDL